MKARTLLDYASFWFHGTADTIGAYMRAFKPLNLVVGAPAFWSLQGINLRARIYSFVPQYADVHTRRAAAVLFTGAVFFSFSLSVFLLSFQHRSLAAAPAASVYSAPSPRPLEVHIANNGLVLVRSARVVAVDGTTITVSTSWGSTELMWIVRTNAKSYEGRRSGTRFITLSGEESPFLDVRAGSLVTITGMLDTTEHSMITLTADSIRALE